MSDLLATLAALGTSGGITAPTQQFNPTAWSVLANGRPAWELWGKGRPRGDCPAHPLLCHMLDVAAVAGLLLANILAAPVRDRLLALHPGDSATALRWLLYVIALHDLGKASPAFQMKLPWAVEALRARGYDFDPPASAKHHGDLGFVLLTEVLCAEPCEQSAARSLARAVAAHHGEFADAMTDAEKLSRRERGVSTRWADARAGIVTELRSLFRVEGGAPRPIAHTDVVILAGLTSVADWIGSMDEVFTYVPPQPSLADYWTVALERTGRALALAGMRAHSPKPLRGFRELFPNFKQPWPLHIATDELAGELSEPSLFIVEAPMGEGKTEAALLLAEAAMSSLSQRGTYFGLPTRATANQMFGRVHTFLTNTHPDRQNTLVLVHGEADLVEDFRRIAAIYDKNPGASRAGSAVRAEGWFLSKKRTLLAEHGVGTVDQPLLGVMRTMHGFVRLYGLAGKVVILDEVHAYDAYTSTILDRLVEWLAALGTSVVLLSATLPSKRREALLKAWRKGIAAPHELTAPTTSYPRISIASRSRCDARPVAPRGTPVTVSLRSIEEDLDTVAQAVVAAARQGCVGWICNTVDRAQDALRKVRALAPEVPPLLVHARLLPKVRAERERTLEQWLGPEHRGAQRPERCIVVGTQVLEQSLDVDYDVLFTDLAPIDLLLQRAGRVFRHRDRTNRSPHYAAPELVVVRPEGAWETVSLKGVAAVYPDALVRATLRLLEGRRVVTLPDDIESLVEAVYLAALPPKDDPLHRAYCDLVGESCAQRKDAKQRLMPEPDEPDDFFDDFKVSFDDDENPWLHPSLRALTRDADDSVAALCLVERDGKLYADEHDTAPLNVNIEPPRETILRLVHRSIAVAKKSAVRSLLASAFDVPEAWRESALLRFRRLVAFRDGVAAIENHRLTLDPELGLVITRTDLKEKK